MPGVGNKISKETANDQMIKRSLPLLGKSEKYFQRVAQARMENGRDKFHSSFGFLKDLFEDLRVKNPGSIATLDAITLDCDEEHVETQRVFRCVVALQTNIMTAKYCRPVISFDAGALKHRLWAGYQVMVAGMIDGDNHDVLVAIAIVPSEDAESYRYFIEAMKKSSILRGVFENPELVIITDKGKA